jgi:eukaryotic-like serine/threonine-protein kinase
VPADKPQYDFLEPPQQAGELGRLGPYQIHGVLGKGGMGEVFEAKDSRLKRTVALKVMKKKFAATSNSRKRFVDEARSMAAIHHDNVATIFEVGVHEGMPFLAMELLRGEPLDRAMQKCKQFDYQQVLRVAREVSRGLAAAHACGIIHRDIKPANIWIEQPSGRAKILDFGLALAGSSLDRLSPRGSVVGSPGYLAPEQARNEPVDDRTDLYSLGVVLYQMCTGKLPLTATTIPGQLIAIICHQPKPIQDFNQAIPPSVCELVHNLLAKEARDRPSSALRLEQLINHVEASCQSESQGALRIVTEPAAQEKKPSAISKSEARPGKRKPILFWLTSTCSLVLLASLAWWIGTRSDRVASRPTVQRPAQTTVATERPVTTESLKALELTPVTSGTSQVTSGDAARFKIRVANNALTSTEDPRAVNLKAKVAVVVTAFLKKDDGPKRKSPAFPKKISGSQLPRPGESKEVEIQFLTGSLVPANYNVILELQSPSGDVISSTETTLWIAENIRDGELLGFERLRTHAGDGADTFVQSNSSDDHGGDKVIEASKRDPEQLHIYLRFDLSKNSFPKEELDRAAILLTVEPGGHQGKSILNAYGITLGVGENWSESGPNHLQWENSPSRDGIERQQFLGQATIDNSGDNLQNSTDRVRIVGQGLDDFIRNATGDLVSIVLVRENDAESPTRFKSQEGKPDQSPALALRRKAK